MTYKCVHARLHSTVDAKRMCVLPVRTECRIREYRSKEQINVSHIILYTYKSTAFALYTWAYDTVRIVYELCIYNEHARQKSLLYSIYTSLWYDIVTIIWLTDNDAIKILFRSPAIVDIELIIKPCLLTWL